MFEKAAFPRGGAHRRFEVPISAPAFAGVTHPTLAVQESDPAQKSAPTAGTVAPAGFIARGNKAFNAGQIDEAVQNYSRALEIDPNSAIAYYERGNAYLARGRLDQALADFSAAIDHNFAGELAFLNRGIVYAQTGAFDLALKDFNEAARLNPSGTEVYYNRGLMYMRAAKYEAAISDFTTATTLNPRHADALAARGAARQAVGETTDAARDYYEFEQIRKTARSCEPSNARTTP